MADPLAPRAGGRQGRFAHPLILLAAGAAVFLGTISAPPSLMDDVDAVNAQIARNMLESGDWVSARINGVLYLEKSPLGYWLMAAGYAVFGVEDWVARLPNALGAIVLMWVTMALGRRGFGAQAGFYAGLAVGTSVGLYLFTRIVIPDVLLTLTVTVALYCFWRAAEEGDRRWGPGFWAAIGVGMLLKGLLAAVAPVAIAGLYLLACPERRRRLGCLRPLIGIPLAAAIYLPWVVLASIQNPPVFDLTLRSDPGVWRGFFWFYFINEHVLRFLGLRFPQDYNTVPRIPFLLLHLVWLFPWSAFLPAAFRVPGRPMRRLAALWILFLLAFLSLSTTQEYYSMPCYPAFALLAGLALAEGPRRWLSAGYGALAGMGALAVAAAGAILYLVRGVEAAGDISSALSRNPEAYTLSLGHMKDLTLGSFAYLRGPLALAGAALAAGTVSAWLTRRGVAAPLCLAAMMVLVVQAAHRAMAVFDPYLSSRPLAEAILRAPQGRLILEGHYYPASSVAFYTNRPALLLNGKQDNLIYGSAAPGVPAVFLEDQDLARSWKGTERIHLVAPASSRPRLESLLETVHVLGNRGGKVALSNLP